MARKAVVVLFFCLLVLGQIPGVLIQIHFGASFKIHPLDILVAFISVFVLLKRMPVPRIVVPFFEFGLIGLAATIIIPFVTSVSVEIESLLFALRVVMYGLFLVYISNVRLKVAFVEKAALLSAIGLAVFGWMQYIFSPDLRWLAGLGWDDHYFRMVSTLLDPAFLGIFLVFGIILSIKLRSIPALLLLTASLAFTYSRSSWLALAVALVYLLIKRYQMKFTVLCLISLTVSILILPNPGGEGVNLSRTNSIEQKTENYMHSISLIEASPLIGWGTGNICIAKSSLDIDDTVNSCRGLDNSFLFIIATTGIIGTIFFSRFVYQIRARKFNTAITASLIALGIHSLFTNTLFYPFAMAWFAVVLGSQKILRGVTQR